MVGDGPTASPPGEAWYLYCLARSGDVAAVEGPGVDGEHGVRLIRLGDIAAVVSRVRVDEFCGAVAEARMRDLAWVAPRVRRHHDVVQRATLASPVVPAPFAVLFSSPERLAAWLGRRREAIASALDRFAEHGEWAVKVILDRRLAEVWLAESVSPEAGEEPPSEGARYLRARGVRVAMARRLDEWLHAACVQIARDLGEWAVEFRERAVVAWLAEEPTAVVANWAFLVPRGAATAFAERVEAIDTEHGERGLRLRASGPWPPYSFSPHLEPDPAR